MNQTWDTFVYQKLNNMNVYFRKVQEVDYYILQNSIAYKPWLDFIQL